VHLVAHSNLAAATLPHGYDFEFFTHGSLVGLPRVSMACMTNEKVFQAWTRDKLPVSLVLSFVKVVKFA